ncbi:hypothetical protein WA026_016849 [Henosepilachna vigintioctopunctata]|uniref:Uncharacterized protein n=1 Tax=Henosepilachna vigintioctopunctata TaxID=420089 RepID=A0AAW1U955_9CUCU
MKIFALLPNYEVLGLRWTLGSCVVVRLVVNGRLEEPFVYFKQTILDVQEIKNQNPESIHRKPVIQSDATNGFPDNGSGRLPSELSAFKILKGRLDEENVENSSAFSERSNNNPRVSSSHNLLAEVVTGSPHCVDSSLKYDPMHELKVGNYYRALIIKMLTAELESVRVSDRRGMMTEEVGKHARID